MIKVFLARFIRGEILLAAAFSCLFVLPALAQSSAPVSQVGPGATASAGSAKSIGPAPANTKQGKIIQGALSPQTRQTLQEAMNSVEAPDTTHTAPATK